MNVLRRAAAVVTVVMLSALGAVPRGAEAAALTTIYTFPARVIPMTGLISGPGGALYGATSSTVYELTQDARGAWHQTTIYNAGAAVLIGSPAALYAATNTGNTVFELLPPAKGATRWSGAILHYFRGDKDGAQPLGLTLAPDGSLFGTTQLGGGSAVCGSQNGVPTGCGTLFRLSESKGKWSETIIHAFQAGTDGAVPVASPTLDAAGNVYVSTSEGGSTTANTSIDSSTSTPASRSPRDSAKGCGVIFSFPPNASGGGNYGNQNLRSLCSGPGPSYRYPETGPYLFNTFGNESKFGGQGAPFAATIADQLIITATGGGNTSKFCIDTSFGGCGGVLMLTRPSDGKPPWSLTVLHEFSGPDGFSPSGYVTGDGPDRVFGVAGSAIGSCPEQGCGEIYTLAKGSRGWAWAVVYRFTTDVFPVPQLTLYKGKILGTTSGYTSRGTIYELTP